MPYLPEHDLVTDRAVLREIVDAHPLAGLITHDGEAPDLDLVPLLWREEADQVRLVGHVARANPLWQPGRQRGPVLATFGPVHHYVTPTSYPSKAEHHRVVPTWNYLVGRIKVSAARTAADRLGARDGIAAQGGPADLVAAMTEPPMPHDRG